jgi:hypothetical protein
MPVHRLLRGRGHDGRGWGRIAAQGSIALGILGALFLTGWMIGLSVTPDLRPAGAGTGRVLGGSAFAITRWVAVVGTAGVLTLLLVAVEIAGLVASRSRRVRLRALAPDAVDRPAAGERMPAVADAA